MPSTTQAALIKRLGDDTVGYITLTTTSSGSTTTVVCTAFANLGAEEDGDIQGWIRCTSGSNDGEVRRIKGGASGYTNSSVTATTNFAFTNTVASGVTFELWTTVDPAELITALNAASRLLYPHLHLPLRDESLTVDNIALNGSFETTLSASLSVPAVERARVGRVAAFVVAASDASALAQSQADQLGDGTADEVQINLAIDALP